MNSKEEEDFIKAYTNHEFLDVIDRFETLAASDLQYLHKISKENGIGQ